MIIKLLQAKFEVHMSLTGLPILLLLKFLIPFFPL
uniref:Uncharacterized protein n=1 Tax=Rhizophora mucronata TaxID=61149 RepID=A0A2P2NIY9_RHIMU